MPSKEGFDYSSNYGEFEVTNQANFVSRDAGKRQNQVSGWIWPDLLPSQTEKYLADKLEILKQSFLQDIFLKLEERLRQGGNLSPIFFHQPFYSSFLIIIALVAALNSFRQAGLILSVAFWCTGLAFLGLTIGQANFGFIGLVGAIGLAGLSINDSIVVLISY